MIAFTWKSGYKMSYYNNLSVPERHKIVTLVENQLIDKYEYQLYKDR